MKQSVSEWRESSKYLPSFLRDFHDQKDLFKAVHETIDVKEHDYVKDISWIAGQCYVIDIFLWFMARFGYTLQKTRTRIEFEDLYTHIENCRERRSKHFTMALNNMGSVKESTGGHHET